jgi:hypothetical protein
VKENETFDPVHLHFFRPQAVMPRAHRRHELDRVISVAEFLEKQEGGERQKLRP